MKPGFPMQRNRADQNVETYRHRGDGMALSMERFVSVRRFPQRNQERFQELVNARKLLAAATLRRGGEGWSSAAGAASMKRTLSAASTHALRTRDARTAE